MPSPPGHLSPFLHQVSALKGEGTVSAFGAYVMSLATYQTEALKEELSIKNVCCFAGCLSEKMQTNNL